MSAADRILAVVQARMSSTRLPGKVLAPVQGKPLLGYLLESLARCREIDGVVLATSTEPSDDPVAAFGADQGVAVVRGPLDDVAGRFARVLAEHPCDAFARICADCPLLDHRLVDRAVGAYDPELHDLVSNVVRRTYPRGQAVEVVNSLVFMNALPAMTTAEEHEHVTAHFYRHPDRYRIHSLEHDTDLNGLRLVVDTPEDLKRVTRLLGSLDRPLWKYDHAELAALALEAAS